ncbi:hypothetical protein QT381_10220 [Galbitalea sp. SE-J8]|uniref:hypothetical protein n=1 Tax=Galbitalea sp. SE-J8 TaxID=3054952 RepID=UPI00259D2A26|nr:hypothetical protein [Galbitalea sp. SE-J8]MDM4763383.1 hypothetical protein [Galbitalea sp. SE-J8]
MANGGGPGGERRTRIAVLPREIASEVVTASVARSGWAVSILVSILDIPVLVDVLVARGHGDRILPPLLCLIAFTAVVVVAGLRRTLLTRVVHLVLGVALATAFFVLVYRIDPGLDGDNTFLLNRPAFALVLLAPAVARPLAGLAWATIGLGVSFASTGLAAVVLGQPLWPGWGPVTGWAVYASAYVILSVVRASQASRIPDLERLEHETRRVALEHEFEQRAAAMVHDTVLGDLTAVMSAPDELDERTRQRFRADVDTLRRPTWLREPGHALDVDGDDSAVRNGTVALVSEMQWRGLTVEVTGTNDEVVRMPPAAREAIHALLRAAFDNVLAHAQVASAELVVGGAASELTYMVIDQGVGFDTATTTGLPAAAVTAIEASGGSVRVWSRVGAGTSVLVSVPVGARVPHEVDGAPS